MNRTITFTGILLILIAIILGAFGAHALKESISMEKLVSYETGVRYQFYHGISLLIIGLNTDKFKFSLVWAYRIILIGVVLFSGSIYLLALQNLIGSMKFLGPVTPLGGSLMIVGWVLILVGLLKTKA